ncbi:hypothetical protein NP233_g12690 [Leucocoprinus birnbaumii]|uniref:Uncharacterized protein n=1 Tax=Leucocoprinus birnbaumii TaxID=56174 RepID=A0AAD5VJM0_9AGAR|nr:hypothetical protein NP233_g12690 [Leucocoprinus birnbaumii]
MGIDEYKRSGKEHPKWRPVMLNPLSNLMMLRSPNILAVGLIGCLALLTDLTLLVPLPYTIGKRYGIENEALIGLCFLPVGIGNAGWISDSYVSRYKKSRGYWYPEDRLRACLTGFYLPMTVIASALITKYVPGKLGLTLNMVVFFFNGVGVDLALAPCGAYVVDVLHANSAEVTAAVNAFRSVIFAAMTAMLLPMINTYGHLFTNSLVGLLAFVGFLIALATVAYGDSMRAWIDIGYTSDGGN